MTDPQTDVPAMTCRVAGPDRLTICGEVDCFSVSSLWQALEDLLAAGATDLVLDMSGVTFIDSAGLGALIRGYKAAQQRHGSLVIREPSTVVTRLLDVTGQLERFTATPIRQAD
jgi:anti-sigma B factor antagonist